MSTNNESSEAPTGAPTRAGQVIVGIDGSPESHEALAYAAEVAKWRNWTLHLVNVWHVGYPIATFRARHDRGCYGNQGRGRTYRS